MPGGLLAQVENAETLTAEVKAELDASAAALDRLEAIGVGGSGGGGGASSAELARLRKELEGSFGSLLGLLTEWCCAQGI